jgi:hypothetical protein
MANNALRDRHVLGRMLLRWNYGNAISKGECQCQSVRCFVRPSAVRQKTTTQVYGLPMSSNNTFNLDVLERRFALLLHAG